MLRFDNIKDKKTLLDLFKFSYEDNITYIKNVLNKYTEKSKINIGDELSDVIKKIDSDDYSLIWIVLELKLLSISVQLLNIDFCKYVIDNLINNSVSIDIQLIKFLKMKLENSLIDEGFPSIYMNSVIIKKYSDSSIQDDLKDLNRDFIEACEDVLSEYVDYIQEKTLKEITSYPLEFVTKFIKKEDLLIEGLLRFSMDMFGLSFGVDNDDDDEVNEIIESYLNEFASQNFKKMRKVDKDKLIDGLYNCIISFIDGMSYLIN